ncbi:DUF2877 domain-containing protein [Terrabacter sp. NPDC080008]|uniref:DUF2877 domain-containing protein n=1 Tax=Terrabacter sp. NPDC080008 TaxID=3155176 RepID=UPI00344CB767
MGDGHGPALLPGAVSPLVLAEVTGPRRRCPVLAAFPTCVYVDLGTHDRVLAVLASDALALPIGVRLAVPSAAVRWGVEPGDEVVVGEGRVRLPGLEVVGARTQRPARVRPARRGRAAMSTAMPFALPDAGVLGDLAHDLCAAALAGDPVEPGVRGLVGVGRGLTPSGDDALCGVLLTLGAMDDAVARRALRALRDAVRQALPATTSLSAALLVAAGMGYAVPDVARLVSLAVAGSAPLYDRDHLLDRVLSIGHSSGRDLLSGVTGTLRAVDASFEPAPQEGAHRG